LYEYHIVDFNINPQMHVNVLVIEIFVILMRKP